MNSNIKEVLESIPDFSEFLNLADEISKMSLEKMFIEKNIKAREAEIVKTVTTESQYFQGGKPPSMSYIDSTYRYSGLNGELLELRGKLSEATAELERLKIRLSVYKDMLEVWRTLSANERSTSL